MTQEQQKSGQFRCSECGQTFNTEHEHREHHEKMHKGKQQGQGQHGGQGQHQHSGQSNR